MELERNSRVKAYIRFYPNELIRLINASFFKESSPWLSIFYFIFFTRQPIAENILVNKALEIMKISDTFGETLNNYTARE